MVELKLFHKVLLAIAVIILLIKLTERFAPKPVAKTLASYIPKRSRSPMPVATPRYEDAYIPPVSPPMRSTSYRRGRYAEMPRYSEMPTPVSAPAPESSGEVFYIKGI